MRGVEAAKEKAIFRHKICRLLFQLPGVKIRELPRKLKLGFKLLNEITMATTGFTKSHSTEPLIEELIDLAMYNAFDYSRELCTCFRKLILCRKEHCLELGMHFLKLLWTTEHSKLHSAMLRCVRDLYYKLRPEHLDFLNARIRELMMRQEN